MFVQSFVQSANDCWRGGGTRCDGTGLMRVRVRKEMQITVAGNVVVATTLTVAGVGWLADERCGWAGASFYNIIRLLCVDLPCVTVWGIN